MNTKHIIKTMAAAAAAAFGIGASADTVTNYWKGGDSDGGGWATASNWSEGVPVSGQIAAFTNGVSVKMSNDDFATGKTVSGIDLSGAGTTLYLTQSATAVNTFPAVNLGEGTVLFTPDNKNAVLKALNGSGTVTNTATEMRILTIGEAGVSRRSDFSGRIDGAIGVNALGYISLTGTESTTPYRLVVLRNKDASGGAPIYGVAEVAKFGKSGDVSSSIGLPPDGSTDTSIDIRFSGWLRYIGTGETTDRNIAIRYLTDGARGYPNTIDAGPHGDLTFTGYFESAHSSGQASQTVFTGSNSVPCVVAGAWKDGGTGTSYITKRGSGIWRFADNSSRNIRAGFAVEEGTLQFDSIAETNVVCSLGLATLLQDAYQGAYSDSHDVDYAYLLGGSTTNVVFEYTGSNFCTVSTRPIALTGYGARLKSSSPVGSGGLSLSGVSALSDGAAVKTLWLAGTNTASCVADISDGDGKVGVTKEGSGTWTLLGNQTFSGPLEVAEGTLVVARKRPYTWFKFVVRGVTGDVFYFNDVGLFNAAGVRQNVGIAAVNPPDMPTSGKGAYLQNTVDYKTLLPGQATVATSKTIYYWLSTSFQILGLFDGTVGNCWRSACTGTLPTWNGEANWIPIVFRLPEGADEVSSCDVVSWSSQSVKAFSIDGSYDGIAWTTLIERKSGSFDYTTTAKWLSDNSTFPTEGDTHIPAQDWHFKGYDGGDGYSMLSNVTGVAVASGATLKAAGDVTLPCLTLDAANGNGTIDGFDFAETGVVSVTNAPSGSFDIPITLSNLPDGALARLNSWSVNINGRTSGAIVTFDGAKATVTRPGCMLIIR